jgi:tellurite resistance protein TerA
MEPKMWRLFGKKKEEDMRLKQKGDEAFISIKHLTIKMTWTTAADFDLAVVFRTKNGEKGIVYFGDLGALDTFPYIRLSKDEGVGDSAGNNEEILEIAQLEEMKYIWLFCWDYGKVKVGDKARFDQSDVTLSLSDQLGNTTTVDVDTGEEGNVCCIATIDNTSATGAMLINASRPATLHKLETLEQLLAIVE